MTLVEIIIMQLYLVGQAIQTINLHWMDQTIFIKTPAIPSVGVSTQDYSLEVIVTPTSTSGNVINMSNQSDNFGWNMPPLASANSTFYAQLHSSANGVTNGISSSFNVNQKYHLVLTWDYDANANNRVFKLYVNNVLVGQRSNITYSASGSNNYFFLGKDNPGCCDEFNGVESRDFAGKYEAFRVYSKALSAQEVAQNYTSSSNQTTTTLSISNETRTFDELSFNLSPTSNSSQAFNYVISDTNVATVNGNTVTIVGVGTTSVTVSQAAGGGYTAATATMTLTINKGTPTISFSNLTKTYGDANFDLSATSSSTGGLTYSIADANIASLSVSNVTIVGAGTTSITVTQAADANYNSATSTITLTVSKLNTTITLSDITKSALDADFDLDATSSRPGTQVVTSGLVLHLDASNTDSYDSASGGNTWYDISGNSNDFTLYGNPTFRSDLNSGTFEFDENNDYAQSNSTTVLNPTQYTKIAVYYPRSSTRNIVSGGNEAAHAFWMSNSNNTIRAGHNSSWSQVIYSPGDMRNSWHYSAVSFSNSDGFKLYYNGNLVDSDNFTATPNGGSPGLVRIASHGPGSNLFDGYIPVVLIYNRVLTSSEIQNNYNNLAQRYGLTNIGNYSNVDLTYSIADTSVATLNGNKVTIVGAGTTTITVSQASDSNFNAGSKTITLTVNTVTPTINFPNEIRTFGDSNFDFSTTSNSSGTFSYIISDTNIATVSGNNVTIRGAGTTSVTVIQAANGIYSSGVATMTLTINKADPTFSFSDLTKTFGDPNFDLSTSSNSNGIITFTISNTSVARLNPITGGLLLHVDSRDPTSYPGSGNTVYDLSGNNHDFTISGNMNYDNTNGFTFERGQTTKYLKQTNFPHPTTTITNEILVKTSSNDNAGLLSYNKTDNDNANLIYIIGGQVRTHHTPGFNRNTNVNLSDNQWHHFVQTIDKSSGVDKIYLDGVLVLTYNTNNTLIPTNGCLAIGQDFDTTCGGFNANDAFGGYLPLVRMYDRILTAEEVAQNYNSLSGATGTGSNTRIVGAGQTVITFTQAATNNYNAVTASMTLTVNKATPTISISNENRTFGDPAFNLSATSSSTGAFTYTISDANVATVIGNTVTIEGGGTTSVTVTQAADSNYSSATSTITLTVNKFDPTIIFTGVVTRTYNDSDFNLSALSSSTASFTYSIADASVATVSGNTVTIVGAGTTTITVSQLANANFNSATASASLIISKDNPTLTNFNPIVRTFGDASFEIVEPTKNGDNTGSFSYTLLNQNIANISGSTVSITNAGQTSITATLSADNNYNSGTISTSFVVNKKNQTITVGALPTTKPLKDFTSIPITASSSSGSPIVISLSAGSAASVSGTVGNYELVSIQQTGLVTITFTTDDSGNPNYNSATTTVVIDVVKTNQNISFNTTPTTQLTYTENLDLTLDAVASSGLALNYSIVAGNNATLNNATLSFNDSGQLTVEITQQGNNLYNQAVPVRVVFVVGQGDTSLSNFTIPTKTNLDNDFNLTPPTSNRLGNITYSSSNINVASLSGTLISINGIGNTTITATQPANSRYKSASISAVFRVLVGDSDGDGLIDSQDNCPTVANPDQADNDQDGVGDVCDNCVYRNNPFQVDTDADGYGDVCDEFPNDASENADSDGDGIGDNADTDDDNDNWSDTIEIACGTSPTDSGDKPIDSDNDGDPDCLDPDDDNDGYLDTEDLFPFDNQEWADNDLDGIGDNADTDDDNDQYLDQDEIDCLTDPFDRTSTPDDFDKDLIPDCIDPNDDNDSCPDTEDEFPLDPEFCQDTDGDGIDDRFDFDSDNDGIPDHRDQFPQDPNASADGDGDGIPDSQDTDKNNDGFPDDQIIVSSVVTPNQPGIEETWKIINIEDYPYTSVRVYAPDGSRVFQSINYKNDWRGTNIRTGNPLPTGPYYYRIELGGTSGEIIDGWLYIFN